jgi:hypothetical protein
MNVDMELILLKTRLFRSPQTSQDTNMASVAIALLLETCALSSENHQSSIEIIYNTFSQAFFYWILALAMACRRSASLSNKISNLKKSEGSSAKLLLLPRQREDMIRLSLEMVYDGSTIVSSRQHFWSCWFMRLFGTGSCYPLPMCETWGYDAVTTVQKWLFQDSKSLVFDA